jgi:light-regulated signal transduction histidine kinase (bacteriophytochrome)
MLEGMIDDLLQLSRAGGAPMRLQPLDLTRMARNIADELTAQGDFGVQVSIEEGLTTVGDWALWSQLLRHAFDNALKFSRSRQQPAIEFGALEQTDSTSFYLRDNGVGCEPSKEDKLFSPFQRLHGPGEYPGRGIGLAIIARIAQRHAGAVRLEGQHGKGATLYITVPHTPV